ncbi:MAG: hypothetical protein M0Z33_02025 [Actinomycetota bacterium]|nr:hypothetical protein [Actinomycetota bacterium]
MTGGSHTGLPSARVLHVVVGHGLPTYFVNCVRSVRATVGADDILVVDVASPDAALREQLERLAEQDPHTELRALRENDVRRNGKVGSLYTAYEIAFEEAIARGFDLVHLVQGDFQVLWWDDDVVAAAREIFESHPRCVNVYTALLSSDKLLGDGFGTSPVDGARTLRKYGVTDTGLFHLGRWRELAMSFGDDEQVHASDALRAGLEVVCHPWPTDAPIPWPAVVRRGVTRGREVPLRHEFLLRPLSEADVAAVKRPGAQTCLEDVCVPWGWVCLTPMWTTGLDSVDYWAARYRDVRVHGLGRLLPRVETRGVVWREVLRDPTRLSVRPSAVELLLAAPLGEISRRARARRERRAARRGT